ncbi:hypothetical protein [Emticicia sp. 17c]|uniref:hypothetical protein n=1 Tax=Emticicia sp. 17c TaxID=3127704 RepID=UPI00301DACCF
MLRIKISIALFNKIKSYELIEKEAISTLESLRKKTDKKDTSLPFVCITGYNGMSVTILEGSYENLPDYIVIKQGIAANGYNNNISWSIINKHFETEQINYFISQPPFQNHSLKHQEAGIKAKYTSHQNLPALNFNSVPANTSTDFLSAPTFEPETWNNNLQLLTNNNCYTYALNIKGMSKPYGTDPNRTPFGNIIYNCLQDGLQVIQAISDYSTEYCIALFSASPLSDISANKINDYHFFRRDSSGVWSHKNGQCNVSNLDFSGSIITNIMQCDTGRYKHFLGLFRVTPSAIEKVSART